MTTFTDGPAMGTKLNIHRTPKLLRVVITSDGKVDVLNNPEDTPTPEETIEVYVMAKEPTGTAHIDRRDPKTGRRSGSWMSIGAEYRLARVQPTEAQSRDTAAWQAWVMANHHEA